MELIFAKLAQAEMLEANIITSDSNAALACSF